MYLYLKVEFADIFQLWLSKVENKNKTLIIALHIDRKKEFILDKLKKFCNKRDIIIKYIALYMHEENRLVK